MNKIPKFNLIDGEYYEGITLTSDGYKEIRVAKWVADMQLFVHKIHHWGGDLTNYLAFGDEEHEYYESFNPLLAISPEHYYKVDNL